jgi:threonine/homoserine/homoserine lactone efflux protein
LTVFGIHDLGLFIAAGLLLNFTPGADFLYILGRGASGGFAAGVWAALGVGAGCCLHILGAALGLSALLATSALAFTVVKWIGAAYLVYLGVSLLRSRAGLLAAAPERRAPASRRRIFWQGFMTNALNPKVALFFLAFVPQFIDAGSTTKIQAFLVLGAIFDTSGTLWNIFVAWSAAALAQRLAMTERIGRWMSRCIGALFVALGVRLALSRLE